VPVKVPDPELEVVDTSPFTAKRKLAIGLAGLGVVGVGGGIILYFNANNLQDKAEAEVDDDEQKPPPRRRQPAPPVRPDRRRRRRRSRSAPPPTSGSPASPRVIERPQLAITPSVGPGGAGIVAVGSF
jgi:hypothetical protein